MRNVKIGCPGYILRNELAKDFAGTLKKVGELGFDGIEITGFFGKSAKEIREACEAGGLEPFGCYAMLPNILCEKTPEELGEWNSFHEIMRMPGETPEEVVEYLREIGFEYIGMCISSDAPTQELFDQINRTSGLVRKYGMKLQYHNHNYEYNNMAAGEYRMDYVLRNISGQVLFEPDLGWMAIGGYDPVRALKKYRNRIESVHLKDYYRGGSDKLDLTQEFQFRPTGYGVMDWATILSLCEQTVRPKWYVADHDSAYEGDIYEELGMSVEYIRGQLKYC